MTYDVAAVRAHFPALRAGTAHFDGPGGTQVADAVARAVAETLTSPIANRGRTTAAERLADDIVVIDRGRIIARGDARKLKREVGSDQIRVVVVDPA